MRVLILLMALLLMAVPVMSAERVSESETQIIMTGGVLPAADVASVIDQPALLTTTKVFTQASQHNEQKQMIPKTGIEAATLDAYDTYAVRKRGSSAISIAGSRDSL